MADNTYEMTKISDFIGIKWPVDMLAETISKNSTEVARVTGGTEIELRGMAARLRGSAEKTQIVKIRRGIVGSWKTDLNPIEKFWVWRISRSLMEEVGYPWKSPW